ncbi:uncharacterized protein LOC141912619 isoform X2 [Tubulanus polymorphus]|uniref:uncharacterized protein LOC141912619 isoform X2 n=1 Tax=Tubulanus polymorphus TaxID=672921 RepID=UPI003DA2EFA6
MMNLYLFGVIFAACLTSGEALQCVACETPSDKGCTETMPSRSASLNRSEDCGKQDDSCMKIITEIYTIDKGGDIKIAGKKVSRFCAQLVDKRDGCTKQQGAGGTSVVCYCRGNHCNGASAAAVSFGLLFVILTSVFAAWRS